MFPPPCTVQAWSSALSSCKIYGREFEGGTREKATAPPFLAGQYAAHACAAARRECANKALSTHVHAAANASFSFFFFRRACNIS